MQVGEGFLEGARAEKNWGWRTSWVTAAEKLHGH